MKRLIDFDAAIQFQSTPSAWRVTLTFFRTLLWAGFQSTPSAWRVTLAGTQYPYGTGISIHTLRVEGDHPTGQQAKGDAHFNPHPPRGG